jgi:hypothetical protein
VEIAQRGPAPLGQVFHSIGVPRARAAEVAVYFELDRFYNMLDYASHDHVGTNFPRRLIDILRSYGTTDETAHDISNAKAHQGASAATKVAAEAQRRDDKADHLQWQLRSARVY